MEDLEVNLAGMDVQEEETSNTAEKEVVTSELIDVEWEKVAEIFKAAEIVKQVELRLAQVCVQAERAKRQLLDQLASVEAFALNGGMALKEELNLDPSLVYELKLPSEEGEKAFFVRKDS